MNLNIFNIIKLKQLYVEFQQLSKSVKNYISISTVIGVIGIALSLIALFSQRKSYKLEEKQAVRQKNIDSLNFEKEAIALNDHLIKIDVSLELYTTTSNNDLSASISDNNNLIELLEKNIDVINLQIGYLKKSENSYKENKLNESLARAKYDLSIACNNLGGLYMAIQDTVTALYNFEKSIALNSLSKNPYANRALIYMGQGKYYEAITDCNKVVEIDSLSADSYTLRAFVYSEFYQNELSLNDYSKAIQIDSNNIMAYVNRGILFSYLENCELKAINDYANAIRIDSMCTSAYLNRGDLYTRINEYFLGLKDLNKVIEIDPNIPQAYFYRSFIYGNTDNIIGKLEDLNKMIELDYMTTLAYARRGTLYFKCAMIETDPEKKKKYLELSQKDDENIVASGGVITKFDIDIPDSIQWLVNKDSIPTLPF